MNRLNIVTTCSLALADALLGHSISGTVKGVDGSVVNAGLVTATLRSAPVSRRRGTTSVQASILPDGSFSLPSLSSGVYQICTQTPRTIWLNSCEWGSHGTTASISPDQPSAQVHIALAKGEVLTIRVNDARQYLNAHEGITAGAHVLLGIHTGLGPFRQAWVASSDAAGRTYQLLLPYDRPLSVMVSSGFFQLTDSTGKPIPSLGSAIPVFVASGQHAPVIVLNVTGT